MIILEANFTFNYKTRHVKPVLNQPWKTVIWHHFAKQWLVGQVYMTFILPCLFFSPSSCHKFDSATHSGYSEWWFDQTLERIPQWPQHASQTASLRVQQQAALTSPPSGRLRMQERMNVWRMDEREKKDRLCILLISQHCIRQKESWKISRISKTAFYFILLPSFYVVVFLDWLHLMF